MANIEQPTLIPGALPPGLLKVWGDLDLAETTTLSGITEGLNFYTQESEEAENAQKAGEPGVYRNLANRMNSRGSLRSGANTRATQGQYRTFAERRTARANALTRRRAAADKAREEAQRTYKTKRDELNSQGEEYQREQPATTTAAVAPATQPTPDANGWVHTPTGSYRVGPPKPSFKLKYTGGYGKAPGYKTF